MHSGKPYAADVDAPADVACPPDTSGLRVRLPGCYQARSRCSQSTAPVVTVAATQPLVSPEVGGVLDDRLGATLDLLQVAVYVSCWTL